MHVTIIGGGIVGLAVCLELKKRRPSLALTVVEKEPQVAKHQSSRNSGVIHTGIYYKPGSLKARLTTSGSEMMREFCSHHRIQYETCGKIILATSSQESSTVERLYAQGIENGLTSLRILKGREIESLEPAARGVSALSVPDAGIVDYGEVARKMADLLRSENCEFQFNAKVQDVRSDPIGWKITTSSQTFKTSFIINCAGLFSDRISLLAGNESDSKIIPFRGEYYELQSPYSNLVKNLIYPVPNPDLPFLGVHLSRTIHGSVECGPNAVLAMAREGYRYRDISIRDIADYAAFPGFWRLARNNLGIGYMEIKRSFFKSIFAKSLRRLVPDVREEYLIPSRSGVRAQSVFRDGSLNHDFSFTLTDKAMHVINAPSPAATASLAIANYLVDRLEKL